MHQQYKDILTSAVEGKAITYWAKGKDVQRQPRTKDEYAYVISMKVGDADPDDDGGVKKGWKLLNERSLAKARDKLVNEDCDVHRSIAAQFVGPIDKWEVDNEGVDAIIQVAFFGKVVYG